MSDPTEFRDFIPYGYQVIRPRQPKKTVIPDWARSRESLRLWVAGPALRDYDVAERYYFQNLSAREIGEELGIDAEAVRQILMRLKKSRRRGKATPSA